MADFDRAALVEYGKKLVNAGLDVYKRQCHL